MSARVRFGAASSASAWLQQAVAVSRRAAAAAAAAPERTLGHTNEQTFNMARTTCQALQRQEPPTIAASPPRSAAEPRRRVGWRRMHAARLALRVPPCGIAGRGMTGGRGDTGASPLLPASPMKQLYDALRLSSSCCCCCRNAARRSLCASSFTTHDRLAPVKSATSSNLVHCKAAAEGPSSLRAELSR